MAVMPTRFIATLINRFECTSQILSNVKQNQKNPRKTHNKRINLLPYFLFTLTRPPSPVRCSIIITGSPISIHQLSGDVDVLINQLNLNYIKHDNHVNVTRIKAVSKNDPSVGVGNSGFRFDVALLLSWCSPSTLCCATSSVPQNRQRLLWKSGYPFHPLLPVLSLPGGLPSGRTLYGFLVSQNDTLVTRGAPCYSWVASK